MKIKTWLILFETPLGSNGYAIVGARKASEAQEILMGQGVTISEGYKIVSIRDFPIPCPNYCAVYQEGVTTIGSGRNGESAYQIAVRLGFNGSEQDWIDYLKKPAIDAAQQCKQVLYELSNINNKLQQAFNQSQEALDAINSFQPIDNQTIESITNNK